MTRSEAANTEERRVGVFGDRVACRRLGSVALDRCRECLYLLRLEADGASAPQRVVCVDAFLDGEAAFAW